ncbi:MAG: glycosyltransferase [Candidatus Rokubacteria bacterium]|nr:glycosyltransferase [Candidatus Rokubacteria bacterium]
MARRLALLTPFAFPSVRGNAVTVERIARGLRARGADIEVWDLSTMARASVERRASEYRPELVHAFHAYRAGPLGLALARRIGCPLVVTLTGTDANLDLFDAERAPALRQVLESAAAVTAFHDSVAAIVARAVPEISARIVVVPQSVDLHDPSPPDGPAPRARGPVMLFPAGIRPVKRPLFPLAPLDSVVARYPGFELRYVGPILDVSEGEALLRALDGRPWARHLGEVPHAAMAALLRDADVVLNCSLSEGGMANSVLEALVCGRAVLASDIAGNRSVIEDGVTGLLFLGPGDFADKAARLLGDPALRERLGEAGRARASRFGLQQEIERYLKLYVSLAPACP